MTVAVGHVQPVGLLEDAVDIHGLDHDAAEISPHAQRDPLPLLRRLVREGALEIGERALVPPIIGRDQPPDRRRDRASHIDGKEPHQADQDAQAHIFEPVLQVA